LVVRKALEGELLKHTANNGFLLKRHLTLDPSPPSDAERETLFWFNAQLIASNSTDSRVGSIRYSKPKSNPS
jgi:hypothetical protein